MKLSINTIFTSALLGLFLLSSCSSAQKVDQSNSDIKNLKEGGCLIFRLPSAARKISYFEEKGWTAKANAERAYIAEKNKSLIAAFQQRFDFCPVYFIEGTEGSLVEEGRLDAVHFLNKNLEHDSSIKPTCKSIYTLTFGDSFKREEGYVGTQEGLILGNQKFITMQSPFPHYSPKRFLFFSKSDNKMVAKLNQKLHGFYK